MKKSIIDVHCHTLISGHAHSTFKENVEEAIKKNIKYLGISDHGPNMPGGPHPFYFYNLHLFPRRVQEVKILRGIEGNIMDYNGNLDVQEDMFQHLDYIIASLHRPCIASGTKEENTNAILKVMDKPKVKIIGHPDDSRYPLDYESIVKRAKDKNVLLEINNSSLSSNSHRTGAWENASHMLTLCKTYGVRVILGTDSHICYSIGEFENAEKVLKSVDFPDELVINYHEDEIIELFDIDF
ncbi:MULTISPECIES: phosphatase [unclassified Clostridioides]|uniref:phosphatase n=1 Tax=unclassified Clostridioides TaxID=2635829 RepID=UPI001D0FC3B8|nr:phosphatase [Clostridioides sp. ES-S-0171-01]MCC0688522.1 phosphatase [Clostridioides sp. ES-S-0056-01]MCC0713572.1 phosphatase [Clostridioides sp. ES-S-0077-01]UDN55484.1 phosphatase [Clostridioides sp. ES-S-0054-01]